MDEVLIMRNTIAWFCVAMLLMSLFGCSPKPSGAGMGADSAPENTKKPAATPLPAGTAEGPLTCNWVLQVDQTIPVEKEGLTVHYTLVLVAQKTGGTDVYGTYEGAAYIACRLDASYLSNQYFDVTGGFDVTAYTDALSFDIVPYDIQNYAHYGLADGELAMPELVQHESMALLSPEMTGVGELNPFFFGENVRAGYYGTSSGTAPVPMKILVSSGKVQVSVPSFTDKRFEGMLLGETDDASYLAALARIESLIEESKSHSEESEGSQTGPVTNGGDMGGIMGTMGKNLPVPAAFPVDELPLASDANVINVYEKEKNIRIIYGTDLTFDELTDFYTSVVEKLNTKMDVEDGVMYMGSTERCSSVILMIMKDKSQMFRHSVMLEVMLK